MKKIKIVLVAASVLAVVGGALAFKASKFGTTYCKGVAYVQDVANSDCTSEVSSTTTNATSPFYAKPKGGLSSCSGQTCPSINLIGE